MWAGNTLGKRECRILARLRVLLSKDTRMMRIGLSPLRRAHLLPKAAEATLFWTSIPGTFLGSSVGRLMPCRQVHQSLQHGFFPCAAETESPTCSFLPHLWLHCSMETVHKTWRLVTLQLGGLLLWLQDHTHGHVLPALPETALSKLFAINGEAGHWKKVCMSCLLTSFPSTFSLQTSNLCNTIYLPAAAYLFVSTQCLSKCKVGQIQTTDPGSLERNLDQDPRVVAQSHLW